MAKLTESATYSPTIFRLETTTPVAGGAVVLDGNDDPVQGHANAQAQLLANRTKYLKGITDTLGTAAVANVTTSTTDTTAGRVTKVGDFGLGTFNAPASGDLDVVRPNQLVNIGDGNPQNPFVGTGATVLCVAESPAYGAQLATANAGTGVSLKYRVRSGPTTWETWRSIYDQKTILGAVSQSGGIPTGAIIERGSNANGGYIKFADGTMVCTHQIDNGAVAYTAVGGVAVSPGFVWVYPVRFAANPRVSGVGSSQINNFQWLSVSLPNVYDVPYRTLIPSASSASNSTADLIAWGRWF